MPLYVFFLLVKNKVGESMFRCCFVISKSVFRHMSYIFIELFNRLNVIIGISFLFYYKCGLLLTYSF